MAKISKRRQIEQSVNFDVDFIGRTKERETFWNDYQSWDVESDDWNLNVINYYGMSGVGKTELANKLHIEHDEKGLSNVYYTFSARGCCCYSFCSAVLLGYRVWEKFKKRI